MADTPHSIALGSAIGIFFGFTPLWSLKTLLSIGVAWVFRCNKLAAAIAVTLHDILSAVHAGDLPLGIHASAIVCFTMACPGACERCGLRHGGIISVGVHFVRRGLAHAGWVALPGGSLGHPGLFPDAAVAEPVARGAGNDLLCPGRAFSLPRRHESCIKNANDLPFASVNGSGNSALHI